MYKYLVAAKRIFLAGIIGRAYSYMYFATKYQNKDTHSLFMLFEGARMTRFSHQDLVS